MASGLSGFAFESGWFSLLVGVAWGAAALWALGAFLTLRGILRQRPLAPSADARLTGGDAPFVSVLVPARNEEHRVWNIPAAYALTVPLAHALFVAIFLNSAARIATGRGVTWKGRRLYERAGVRPPRRRGPGSPASTADDG